MNTVGGGIPVRGRAAEMAAAVAALRRASGTGQGGVVLVTGEAGIGKTVLLRAVADEASREGFAVGVGRAEEIGQIAPGAPLLVALRSGPDPLLDGTGFADLAPLHGQPPWLVDRIAGLLEELALRSPVLVSIDDVHWADPLTRFALRVLPGRLAGSPVVWLLAGRGEPAAVVDELAADADVVHVELGPLAPGDVEAMACDRLAAAPDERTRQLLRGIGGNPFWAMQLLDGLVHARAVGRPDDDLPAELVVGVVRRLAALPAPAVDLIRLVAVMGRAVRVADAAAMLGDVPPGEVIDAARQAGASGLLVQSGDRIELPHDLLRQAVYADIPAALRLELHEACGRRLLAADDGLLAAVPHVLRASGPTGGPDTVALLIRAATVSVGPAPDQAAELAQEAFRRTGPGDERWPATGEECIELLLAAQHEREALVLADTLLRSPLDADALARVQFLACRALWPMGLPAQIAARADAVLGRPDVAPVLRARLSAARALPLTREGPGHVAEAEAVLAEGIRLDDAPTRRMALIALGEAARNEGRHQLVLERVRELRAVSGVRWPMDEVLALHAVDRYDEAAALLDAARRGSGPDALSPALLHAQMWHDMDLGRIEEAEAGAHTLVRLCDELGSHRYTVHARMALCVAATLRGDRELGWQRLRSSGRLDGVDDTVRMPPLALLQGWMHAQDGDVERSAAVLRPLMESAGPAAGWQWYPWWIRVVGKIGVLAGVRELTDRAVAIARTTRERSPGILTVEGVELQLCGIAARDPRLLARSVDVLRRGPRLPFLADALADHGEVLLEVHERDAAVTALTEALTLHDRLGFTVAAGAVRHQLSAAGVRPVTRSARRPEHGWAALTDSEMRVAELIGAGHTNRAAATMLGVSPNTVGTHLRAIFTKLDVRSRVQLANALHQYLGAAEDHVNT